MHHQIEHIRAIQADHLRVAERHRLASMAPRRPPVWTRLVGRLSPRLDTSRPGGERRAGLATTSTQDV